MIDAAEQDIPSNPITEVHLARSNLYRSCDTGIATLTWPEISSNTNVFSSRSTFKGNNQPGILTAKDCFQIT